MLLLFCSACSNKNKQAEDQADISFDKTKWNEKKDDQYVYRKQMINGLLKNYQWTSVQKDSVIQMLGQPDAIEEGNLMYDYKKSPSSVVWEQP